MDLQPIRQATMVCPLCHTGVKLNVTCKNDVEAQELLTISESIACPKCKTKFGGATKLIKSINSYNESVRVLNLHQTEFNVELD